MPPDSSSSSSSSYPSEAETNMFVEFFLLFLSGSMGALFPLLAIATSSSRSAVLLTFGNAFAGGVMLTVALVHLLADAVDAASKTVGSGDVIIPRSCFILCVMGIILPFSLEKGGLLVFLLRHGRDTEEQKSSLRDDDDEHEHHHGGKPLLATPKQYGTVQQPSIGLHRSSSQGSISHHAALCVMPALVSTQLQVRLDFLRSSDLRRELDLVPHAPTIVPKDHAHDEMQIDVQSESPQTTSPHQQHRGTFQRGSPSPPAAMHDIVDTIPVSKHTHFSSSWLLLSTVLIIHSVLAGFCLGIQPARNRTPLFFALVFHKLFESMAMGIASSRQPLGISRTLQLVVFILADPVGLLMGRSYYMSSDAPSLLTRSYMLSICAGTFLYASLCEVLQEEFMDGSHRIQKFVAFVVGAMVMCLFD